MLLGNELRQESLAGGHIESADGAIEKQRAVDGPWGGEAMDGKRHQQQGTERESEVTGLQDALARYAVGGVASQEKEKDAGQELRQPDEAEIEGAMGEGVDLPGHAEGLHFGGGGGEEAGGHEIAEARVLEGDARGWHGD